MPRILIAVALAWTGAFAHVAAAEQRNGDPLRSPECLSALAALQADEAAAASPPRAQGVGASSSVRARTTRGADPKLGASRRRAASACLASRADVPAPPGRFAQPPLAASSVVGVRPPLAPAPTTTTNAAIPARLPGQPPLVSITSCDAAGCWTSDGSRLNRVGPTLWGSGGACSVQGSVVHCP